MNFRKCTFINYSEIHSLLHNNIYTQVTISFETIPEAKKKKEIEDEEEKKI